MHLPKDGICHIHFYNLTTSGGVYLPLPYVTVLLRGEIIDFKKRWIAKAPVKIAKFDPPEFIIFKLLW
jgi:hypothetical protein